MKACLTLIVVSNLQFNEVCFRENIRIRGHACLTLIAVVTKHACLTLIASVTLYSQRPYVNRESDYMSSIDSLSTIRKYTYNLLYTDTRYNNKIRYNDNFNVTKPSLKR